MLVIVGFMWRCLEPKWRPTGRHDRQWTETNAEVAAVTHAQSRVRAVPEVSKTIRVVGTIDVWTVPPHRQSRDVASTSEGQRSKVVLVRVSHSMTLKRRDDSTTNPQQ